MKDKRMLYMMSIGLGIIVLIIIIIVIIASVSGKSLSYEKIEDKMKDAAMSYYQSRAEELPRTNGGTVTVSAQTLSDSKEMKSLAKLQPKGSSCTGNVIVTKNGEHYLYSPVLDCGNDYRSKKLYEVVTKNENIVASGEGLYSKTNGYVFKGENVNNLVRIDENLWAIMDIDSEGYIRLVSVNYNQTQRAIWDDRYNVNEDSYNGINNYSVSRIKEFLKELEEDEDFLLEDSKAYVALKKWCIGKRSESNLDINNEEECGELSEEQMFGLPLVSDAVVSSIDPNCNDIDDASCDNYNYFSNYAIASWTLTGVKESTSKAYYLVGSSYVPTKTSTMKKIVPVIYLSKNVMYASGDGTLENPYLLK